MSSRHIARSVVFQTAFEWDFRNLTREQAIESLPLIMKEFGDGESEKQFAETLLKGVIDKKEDLDNIITKAAPDWPLDKISITDRNILRVGLYELLFADRKEVPAKVAINEAIELAKVYGGEKSGGFINGVLGTVYKELGEPGKDESSKVKNNVPFEKMPIKRLAGAVVYAIKDETIYLAFVHDVFGRWTLSKDKLKDDEDLKSGAIRGVKEKMGVDVTIESELSSNEYIANHPQDGKIRKQVTYFLASTEMQDLTLGESGGLDDAKWFKLQDIESLNFYNDIMPIITKAISIIGSKISK
jgi:N utilization substance protein B